jgi:hypothetical protein
VLRECFNVMLWGMMLWQSVAARGCSVTHIDKSLFTRGGDGSRS